VAADRTVLYVVHSLPSGGIERVLAMLCAGLDRRRWAPVVACLVEAGTGAGPFEALDVPIHVVGGVSSSHPRHVVRNGTALSRLLRLMARERPAVVQAEMFFAGTLGRVAAACCRVPVVVHGVHNCYPWKGFLARRVDGFLARFTSVMVTPTAAVADWTARQLGLPRDRFTVVPNGVPRPSSPLPDRPVLRRHLGLSPDDEVVVFCARFVEQKNPVLALSAVAALVPRRPRLRLVMVGDGPLVDPVRAAAAKAPCPVTFVGRLGDPYPVLGAADVVVTPSTREGFGLVPGEALLAGSAVLLADLPPLREVYGILGDDFFVPATTVAAWADVLSRLLDDAERRSTMVAAGRARMQQCFAPETMVAAYAALYEG